MAQRHPHRTPYCFASYTVPFSGRGMWVWILVWMVLPAGPLQAQAWLFGSRDDPAEQASVEWWNAYAELTGAAGFSLIGPQWRGVTRVDLEARGADYAFGLEGSFRSGIYGRYDVETDEWRDALRVLAFARYRPADGSTYLRAGPLERTRLGSGHLVNFYSSAAIWDDRTIGVELQRTGANHTLEAFTSDVTRKGLTGLRFAVAPFDKGVPGPRSLEFSAAVVEELGRETDLGHPFRGFEGAARMVAYRSGSFDFVPFASVAWLPEYGQGVLVGANLENANFIDTARLYLSLALHYNSADFRHGYFGTFYEVSGPGRSIIEAGVTDRKDIPLRDVERGNSILFESRILFFERFELWYAFQRYHGAQHLSEYHLRLLFNSRNVQVAVSQDRRGLKGFTSLFGELGEENRLRFGFDLRLLRQVWLLMDAHYTYRLNTVIEGNAYHSIQRRFDPVIGLRARF